MGVRREENCALVPIYKAFIAAAPLSNNLNAIGNVKALVQTWPISYVNGANIRLSLMVIMDNSLSFERADILNS